MRKTFAFTALLVKLQAAITTKDQTAGQKDVGNMRLICPNCSAQYDIANDAIPEGGRDVQCSSCAHTWFQTEKPVVAGRSPSETLVGAAPADNPETLERKPLDSSISDILREEVQHEKQARNVDDGAPPPTQAETAPPVVDAEETRKRIAQMTQQEGGTPAREANTPARVAAAATGAVATDANLRAVPSIDEINASLRARAEASDTSGLTEAEKNEAVKRSGFRRGFFFVLILLAILITPYFFQDQINANLPQLSPYMATYVDMIDQLRLWLNEQAQSIQGLIEGFISSDAAAPAAADN